MCSVDHVKKVGKQRVCQPEGLFFIYAVERQEKTPAHKRGARENRREDTVPTSVSLPPRFA